MVINISKKNNFEMRFKLLKYIKSKKALFLSIIIMVPVFILTVFMFYNFIVNQIYEERKRHLNEISKQTMKL